MIPSDFDILWISSSVRQELLLEKNDKTVMLLHHCGEKKTQMLFRASFIHLSVLVPSAPGPFRTSPGQRWTRMPVRVSGGDLEQPYVKAASCRMLALVHHVPSAA